MPPRPEVLRLALPPDSMGLLLTMLLLAQLAMLLSMPRTLPTCGQLTSVLVLEYVLVQLAKSCISRSCWPEQACPSRVCKCITDVLHINPGC